MENKENRVELTDQQLDAVTGGLSARLAGYTCGDFEESEESFIVRGGCGYFNMELNKDCVYCKYWNSEEASCTLGHHSESRFFDPEWPGADPA